MHRPRRPLIVLIAALAAAAGLFSPAGARASTTLTAAPASQYDTTPDCPVSATNIVCAWNLPQDAGNAFGVGDYGQCPYWAAEKYPALVQDEASSDPLSEDWDGSTWAEHAEQEGLSVSTTPASGDLAVWQATASDPPGHVAYVEAVLGDAIIVSQMDGNSTAPFPALQGSTEYISAANLTYFEQTYGLEFIHTGQPSTTPLSYVEAPGATTTTSTTPATASTTSSATTASAPAGSAKAALTSIASAHTRRPARSSQLHRTHRRRHQHRRARKHHSA